MEKSNKVVIFGTGSFAEIVHYYLSKDSDFEVVGFTADDEFIKENSLFKLPLVPFSQILKIYPPTDYKMFIAIGYNKVNQSRAEKYFEAKKLGYELVSYICSKNTYWDNLSIGDNCFILEDQTIQPFVEIGNNVIIWSGNHIGHHSTIMDHCYITSQVTISGFVRIEPFVFIGVNASIRNNLTIAKSSVIGMGATIVKNTAPKGVYVTKSAELYIEDSSKLKRI